MTWRTITLATVALVAVACATAPQGPTSALEGRWAVVAAERDGRPADELTRHVLTLRSREFVVHRDRDVLYRGTFTTDAAARPDRIDFRHTDGEATGRTWLGIYRLEGDRLTIVDNAPDASKPRPTSFTTAPGSGHVRLTFTRAAP